MIRIRVTVFCIVMFSLTAGWSGWNGSYRRRAPTPVVVTTYTDITTNMTSDSDPSPLATAYSTRKDSTHTAFYAFDGVTNGGHGWDSISGTLKGWIRYDWGTNITQIITKYDIIANTTGSTSQSPTDWVLYGSNVSSALTIVDERHAETGWLGDERRSYVCTNSGAYRYYVLNCLTNDGSPLYIGMQEVRWYSSP